MENDKDTATSLERKKDWGDIGFFYYGACISLIGAVISLFI